MIITLCGSARFEPWFHVWNEALTLAGHTVFSLSCFPSVKRSREWYTEEQKSELDAAHRRKIEASDAIFVLNVAAYIGSSTMGEINHAKKLNRGIYFLESWGEGRGIGPDHSSEHRSKYREFFESSDGITRWPTSPIDTFRVGIANPWSHVLLGNGDNLGRRAAIAGMEVLSGAPDPQRTGAACFAGDR